MTRLSEAWPVLLSGRSIYPAAALVLFGVLAVCVFSGATLSFDMFLRETIHRGASPILTVAATAFSFLAALKILLPVSLLVITTLWLTGRRRPALAVVATMVGALILNGALKSAFHRARPDPFFGVDPETFSFPSGHVLFAACFLGALVMIAGLRGLRAASAAVAVLLVGAVGWSRIYLGVHYPTDVLAGLLLAAFWLGVLRMLGIFDADRRSS